MGPRPGRCRGAGPVRCVPDHTVQRGNSRSHHWHKNTPAGHPFPDRPLTATVVATAATICDRQRPASPADASTLPNNPGYARPEKLTFHGERTGRKIIALVVERQRRWHTGQRACG